ncbi:MAG TPA: alpha-galactosidase, partial [Parvularcula sp.]|nr:alpha-galactosidase [Parvularcula sp.]
LAAATLPLPGEAVRVRYYSGRHNREFEINEEALSRAIWRRENRRGLTSHDAFPGALALTAGAGEDHDLVYGAQLAWSGNHAQTIERVDDGRRQWQLGEWLAPGEVRLAPDETLHSPEVLATCSLSGANGVARNFHRAIRARMNWPGGAMKPRPVHLNTWEAFYFNHR